MVPEIKRVNSKKNKLTLTANKQEMRVKIDSTLSRAVLEDMGLYFLRVADNMPNVDYTVRGSVSFNRYLEGREFILSNNARNKHYAFDAKGILIRISGDNHVVA